MSLVYPCRQLTRRAPFIIQHVEAEPFDDAFGVVEYDTPIEPLPDIVDHTAD